jgi:hypothetical protein
LSIKQTSNHANDAPACPNCAALPQASGTLLRSCEYPCEAAGIGFHRNVPGAAFVPRGAQVFTQGLPQPASSQEFGVQLRYVPIARLQAITGD